MRAHLVLDPENHQVTRDERIKRQLDCIVAFALLLFIAPFLALLSALVALSSGLPIFVASLRVGYDGAVFPCFKFRTMVVDADAKLRAYLEEVPEARKEWETTLKLKNDPRITPIGRFLRRTSLDELPQLINVIRGEMSLVGPRPILLSEVERYGPLLQDYTSVRPGITGPWQVSGRGEIPYEARIKLQAGYGRNWSLASDLSLIIQTLRVVLTGKGAY